MSQASRRLQLVSSGDARELSGIKYFLRLELGENPPALQETANFDGQTVKFKPGALADSDYELLTLLEKHWGEPQTLQKLANALIRIHSRERVDAKQDREVLDADLQALRRQNPNLQDLKLSLETIIKNDLKVPQLLYNLDYTNLFDPPTEGRLQCYSGTALFEVALAALSTQMKTPNSVNAVIYTNGHVLPGVLNSQSGSWMLTGIETTSEGAGLVPFGKVSDLAVPMNVVESMDFLVAEVFKYKFADPAAYVAAVRARMIKQYQFNSKTFQTYTDKGGGYGGGENLNASLFGFGVPNVPGGDLKRSAITPTPADYNSGSVGMPVSKSAAPKALQAEGVMVSAPAVRVVHSTDDLSEIEENSIWDPLFLKALILLYPDRVDRLKELTIRHDYVRATLRQSLDVYLFPFMERVQGLVSPPPTKATYDSYVLADQTAQSTLATKSSDITVAMLSSGVAVDLEKPSNVSADWASQRIAVRCTFSASQLAKFDIDSQARLIREAFFESGYGVHSLEVFYVGSSQVLGACEGDLAALRQLPMSELRFGGS